MKWWKRCGTPVWKRMKMVTLKNKNKCCNQPTAPIRRSYIYNIDSSLSSLVCFCSTRSVVLLIASSWWFISTLPSNTRTKQAKRRSKKYQLRDKKRVYVVCWENATFYILSQFSLGPFCFCAIKAQIEKRKILFIYKKIGLSDYNIIIGLLHRQINSQLLPICNHY